MSTELMPFQFNTHNIRVRVDDHDMPWWIATDVGAVLGHTNISVMMKRLDEDEKTLNSTYPNGPDAWFVNEFGLYKLLMGSRKPEAKEFQRWVTHEVIPQIRKTGKYEPKLPALDHHPDLRAIVQLASGLAEARDIAEAARTEAAEAKRDAAEANTKADMLMDTQPFRTVAEYVHFEKLTTQIPESAYRTLSDHIRLYCLDKGIPFRRVPIGGKSWPEEYAYHTSTYAEALPGWLQRRYAQTSLRVIHPTQDAR